MGVHQKQLLLHNLSTREWLTYFHNIVLLEVSTAQINNAKFTILEMWSYTATQIKVKLRGKHHTLHLTQFIIVKKSMGDPRGWCC